MIFYRLSTSEKEAYLRQLLGDETLSEDENFSDSDDERAEPSEISDNDNGDEDSMAGTSRVEVDSTENNEEEEETEEEEEDDEENTENNTNEPSASQNHFQATDGTI